MLMILYTVHLCLMIIIVNIGKKDIFETYLI